MVDPPPSGLSPAVRGHTTRGSPPPHTEQASPGAGILGRGPLLPHPATDSFMVTTGSAQAALLFTLDVQTAFFDHDWGWLHTVAYCRSLITPSRHLGFHVHIDGTSIYRRKKNGHSEVYAGCPPVSLTKKIFFPILALCECTLFIAFFTWEADSFSWVDVVNVPSADRFSWVQLPPGVGVCVGAVEWFVGGGANFSLPHPFGRGGTACKVRARWLGVQATEWPGRGGQAVPAGHPHVCQVALPAAGPAVQRLGWPSAYLPAPPV